MPSSSFAEPLTLRLIERPRLLEPLLAQIRRQRVSFIQGPAGSGKSVLLDQAFQAVAGQLQTARLSLASSPLSNTSLRASLLSLFSRLCGQDRGRAPFVIFIDDADQLLGRTDPSVLRQCLSSLPAQGKLVIASRRKLALHHFGLASEPGEPLQLGQLLFTPQELRQALSRHGQPLDAAALMAAWRFSEGWPAVLALLCASDVEDGSLDAEHMLQAWFEEELFSDLGPALLRFAFEASAVGQIQTQLLDWVRGRCDSQGHIRGLAHEHGLLLDGGTRLPRPLLATLRRQHRRDAPLRVRELHRAALETLLDLQRLEPALEQAYQLGDRPLLLGLLQRHGHSLLCQGRMRSLSRWLGELDAAGLLESIPRLQLTLAWALLFSNDQAGALAMVTRLRAGPRDGELDADLCALELTSLSMRDQVQLGLAQADLRRANADAGGFAGGVQQCTRALLHLLDGELQAVEDWLTRRLDSLDSQSGAFVGAYARAILAMGALLRGEPDQSRNWLRQAREQLAGEQTPSHGNSLLATLQALALYESGRIDEVRQLLELHLPLLRQTGLLDQIILAHKLYARILLNHEQGSAALEVLAALECLGRDGQLPRMVICARLEQARCALSRGDLAQARALFDEAAEQRGTEQVRRYAFLPSDSDSFELLGARLALAEGRDDGLVEGLAAELERGLGSDRLRRALSIRILLALALERRGHEHAALRMIEAALSFAAPRGLKQAFLDEGPAVLALVQRVGQGVSSLATFAASLLLGSGLSLEHQPATVPVNASLLTAKEVQVLALMASGQSNDALARLLFVSESTVRTHLRSINAKLNARSRLEALAIARREGLIAG
ncbi:LuxR C-terminal-related transcriptional regulator [Pseudomonas sp. Marseille-P9899]|uniref:LuxR C-terminal-related transcriptional regulator n=1 Tax=Pseudomonas sp. Marseille-P9899 TaxID=2730401 RepID=UPI001588386B|nr:LuxR C-terminal-related transcriptional regulator [Pseudomonas sp. Marseille-P9899]